MRTLLLTFIFAAFGSICAQADPKPPADPCDTARKFIKLIADYGRTKEDKLLNMRKGASLFVRACMNHWKANFPFEGCATPGGLSIP